MSVPMGLRVRSMASPAMMVAAWRVAAAFHVSIRKTTRQDERAAAAEKRRHRQEAGYCLPQALSSTLPMSSLSSSISSVPSSISSVSSSASSLTSSTSSLSSSTLSLSASSLSSPPSMPLLLHSLPVIRAKTRPQAAARWLATGAAPIASSMVSEPTATARATQTQSAQQQKTNEAAREVARSHAQELLSQLRVTSVTRSNFDSVFESAMKPAIMAADFVTVDLEMSGVESSAFRRAVQLDTALTRFCNLRNSAANFGIIQLGVSTFKWDERSSEFVIRSFNCHCFPHNTLPAAFRPARHRSFLSQISSLEFLSHHGIDFNTWVNQGIPYLSEAEERAVRQRVGLLPREASDVVLSLPPQVKHPPLRHPFMSSKRRRISENLMKEIGAWVEGVREERRRRRKEGERARGGLEAEEVGIKRKAGDEGRGESTLSSSSRDVDDRWSDLIGRHPSLLLRPLGSVQLQAVRDDLARHFPTLPYEVVVEGAEGRQTQRQLRLFLCETAEEKERLEAALEGRQQSAAERSIASAVGLRRVLQVLAESQKPIVGHNCLLDLAHLFHKFVGPLPDCSKTFAFAIRERFPLVIDTKVLVRAAKDVKPRLAPLSTQLAGTFERAVNWGRSRIETEEKEEPWGIAVGRSKIFSADEEEVDEDDELDDVMEAGDGKLVNGVGGRGPGRSLRDFADFSNDAVNLVHRECDRHQVATGSEVNLLRFRFDDGMEKFGIDSSSISSSNSSDNSSDDSSSSCENSSNNSSSSRDKSSTNSGHGKHEAAVDAFMTGVIFIQAARILGVHPSALRDLPSSSAASASTSSDAPSSSESASAAHLSARGTAHPSEAKDVSMTATHAGSKGKRQSKAEVPPKPNCLSVAAGNSSPVQQLVNFANVVSLGRIGPSETAFDLVTGDEADSSRYPSGPKLPPFRRKDRVHVAVIWGLPADMGAEKLRRFLYKALGKSVPASVEFLDDRAAFVEFHSPSKAAQLISLLREAERGRGGQFLRDASAAGVRAGPFSIFEMACATLEPFGSFSSAADSVYGAFVRHEGNVKLRDRGSTRVEVEQGEERVLGKKSNTKDLSVNLEEMKEEAGASGRQGSEGRNEMLKVHSQGDSDVDSSNKRQTEEVQDEHQRMEAQGVSTKFHKGSRREAQGGKASSSIDKGGSGVSSSHSISSSHGSSFTSGNKQGHPKMAVTPESKQGSPKGSQRLLAQIKQPQQGKTAPVKSNGTSHVSPQNISPSSFEGEEVMVDLEADRTVAFSSWLKPLAQQMGGYHDDGGRSLGQDMSPYAKRGQHVLREEGVESKEGEAGRPKPRIRTRGSK